MGWQRSGIASRVRIGEVLKDHLLVRVHLNNPAMRRISDQRITIGQSAGISGCTEPLIVLPYDRPITSNLDDTIVVLVTNEDMTVGKQFGTIGVVERARARLWAIGPGDLFAEAVYFDDAIVGLIDDHDITTGQLDGKHRCVQLVGARACHASLSILPDNLALLVDDDDAVVITTFGVALGTGGDARSNTNSVLAT